VLLAALMLSGCGLFGNAAGDGGTSSTPSQYGFGGPALEVTINGVHFGPAAPDPGSGVSLSTSRDGAGQIDQAILNINASSTAGGASIALGFQRYGTNIAGFTAGYGYTVAAGSGLNGSPDGTILTGGSETVAVADGTFQCTGSGCEGGALLLTVLQADHVEGSYSGNFDDTQGRGTVPVVCSFWLPTLSYAP
jgi:hypothetical protein